MLRGKKQSRGAGGAQVGGGSYFIRGISERHYE